MTAKSRLKALIYLNVAELVAAFLGLLVMAVLIPVPGSPDQYHVSTLRAALGASMGVSAIASSMIVFFLIVLGLNVHLLRRLRRDAEKGGSENFTLIHPKKTGEMVER